MPQLKLKRIPKITPDYRLPTNTTTKKHSIHRWFNFVAGFSPEFVEECCKNSNLKEDSIILDPFAGCGTTLVTCNTIGINSIGYERHPFFFEIAKAKTIFYKNPEIIFKIKGDRLKYIDCNSEVPNVSEDSRVFLEKLIEKKNLNQLLIGTKLIDNLSEDEKYLFRLYLSKILDLVSHSKTDGIYKAPTSRKKGMDLESAIDKCTSIIHSDLKKSQFIFSDNLSQLYLKSSEDMSELLDESIDMCVTSPPYLNNFDYAEMTRMYLYFWQIAKNWKEITEKIRNKLIVNTTTALKGHRELMNEYKALIPLEFHDKFDYLYDTLLEEKKHHSGKKDYYLLVYPYFGQMFRVINEVHRVLKSNGTFNMVIGDSALYGVHIETHILLGELMEKIGFEILEIKKLRSRGDRWILEKRKGSKKGLGEYQIIAKKG